MERPFALFLTWTCYGTWLPGDPRGYVSPTFDPQLGRQPKQNRRGSPFTENHAATRLRAAKLQKSPTFLLGEPLARAAAAAILDSCLKRQWRLVRGALMGNHVHVLIMDCPNHGPTVRRILKGTSQARLNDEIGSNLRRWTIKGSDRYLNDWDAIERVMRYIEEQVGKLAEIRDGILLPQPMPIGEAGSPGG